MRQRLRRLLERIRACCDLFLFLICYVCGVVFVKQRMMRLVFVLLGSIYLYVICLEDVYTWILGIDR